MFARRDKNGTAKRREWEGAVHPGSPRLQESPVRSVVVPVHKTHSPSCCLVATSTKHIPRQKKKLKGIAGTIYPSFLEAEGTCCCAMLCGHGATSQLSSKHGQWCSWGTRGAGVVCETHAGGEGISVGLICVKPHTLKAATFAIAKLAILKLAQACLCELLNRNGLQAALL